MRRAFERREFRRLFEIVPVMLLGRHVQLGRSRYSRRRVMIIADLARAVVALPA